MLQTVEQNLLISCYMDFNTFYRQILYCYNALSFFFFSVDISLKISHLLVLSVQWHEDSHPHKIIHIIRSWFILNKCYSKRKLSEIKNVCLEFNLLEWGLNMIRKKWNVGALFLYIMIRLQSCFHKSLLLETKRETFWCMLTSF